MFIPHLSAHIFMHHVARLDLGGQAEGRGLIAVAVKCGGLGRVELGLSGDESKYGPDFSTCDTRLLTRVEAVASF